jgi:hypothetical protein
MENPDSTKAVQDMMLLPYAKKIEKKISITKKRETTSKTLLTAQGIRHGEKCCRCGLNCEVKRKESVEYDKIFGNEKAIYKLETCPKQGKLEKLKIKKKGRQK